MPEIADSVRPVTPVESVPATLSRQVCVEAEAPSASREKLMFTARRLDYIDGLPPRERQMLPGYDSAVIVVLLLLFGIVASNFKHYSTYIKSLSDNLLTVRRRANAFNEHTVNETRVSVSLVAVACVSEAILLFSVVYTLSPSHAIFPLLMAMVAVTVVYYMVELIAYSTIGNVFTDHENAVQWLKGFNASQSLLGIALVIPALVTLFYPGSAWAMAIIGAFLYITARIVFIYKGFKIFYYNLFSLLYFILYLCAVEIAPLVMVFRGRYLIDYI